MNLLIVRCQNGMVVWKLGAIRDGSITTARCLNDGFLVTSNLITEAEVVDYLQRIATHSAALRGSLQAVSQLHLPT